MSTLFKEVRVAPRAPIPNLLHMGGLVGVPYGTSGFVTIRVAKSGQYTWTESSARILTAFCGSRFFLHCVADSKFGLHVHAYGRTTCPNELA